MRTCLSSSIAFAIISSLGCSKKPPDDCQRFLDKARPILNELASAKGVKATADDDKVILDECRNSAKMRSGATMSCVLGATGDAAIRACFGSSLPPAAPRP